jgi:hypothetical protein
MSNTGQSCTWQKLPCQTDVHPGATVVKAIVSTAVEPTRLYWTALSAALVDGSILDTRTRCSSIYAVRFGMERVMGLRNGEIGVTEVGDLEAKDAGRYRIKWFASAAVFSVLGAVRMKGIRS